jgi:penicillin-binding protein 1A
MPERLKALAALLRRHLPARLSGYFRTLLAPGLTPWQRGRHALRGIAFAALGAVALLVVYTLLLIPFTPSVDNVRNARSERPSVLLAADGSVIATYRRLNREWIPLERVPQPVVDALIATEDHRFWQHAGIDWRRSLAAVGYTLGGDRQGGSTLTQQLARNLFPEDVGRAPTATRKLKEMITAIKLERAYSKREILEIYLNTVPFLYNAVGIEMAARTYFDKKAAELTLVEGAVLVGMLKGTSAYNPVRNPERALERRNVVLAQMVKHGKLSQKAYDNLRRRPLRLDFERQDLDAGPAPHFSEAVRRWLIEWAEERGYNIYADGLVVRSTLDPRLQRAANRAVARQLEGLQAVADVEWGQAREGRLSTSMERYRQARRQIEPFGHFWATRAAAVDAFIQESPEYVRLVDDGSDKDEALAQLRADGAYMAQLRAHKTRLEAGFVALDPRNGQVRAWVGSRDFQTDHFDHVLRARRQPGSTFKPFVYGAALEAGMDAGREFEDRPVAISLPEGGTWKPGDMGGASGRYYSLEEGLVYSRNTVTAQVIAEVGPRKVAQFAQRLGVRESPLDVVPSLGLGTSPVTLLEMVGAYGTIAALGQYQAPVLVTRITDQQGKPLAEFAPLPERALDEKIAVRLIDMLRGVVDRGTGRGIRNIHHIEADVAGKTGTTQNNTDGWFILMHPQLVAGAWVGFNDPRVTLRSDYWGQGAHNALHVVGDFMAQALAGGALNPAAEFPGRESPSDSTIEAALRRSSERLLRWLGFEAAPPKPVPRPPPRELREEDAEPAEVFERAIEPAAATPQGEAGAHKSGGEAAARLGN